ncbi:hypothetical protein Dimus_005069 [Dionaea muscipula]
MQKFRRKNKLKRKLKFRGNQERKGLRWNIQDHGVDPSGHLPDYELIYLFHWRMDMTERIMEVFV